MLVITYGTALFGKIDAVPRLGSVCTKCSHIWHLPLIPRGTFFVLEPGVITANFQAIDLRFNLIPIFPPGGEHSVFDVPNTRYGIPLKFSFTSWFTSLARGASYAAMGIASIWTWFELSCLAHEEPHQLELVGTFFAATAFCLWFSRRLFRTASYELAMELAELVGASSEIKARIEFDYQRIDAAELAVRLNQLARAVPGSKDADALDFLENLSRR